MRTTSIVGLLTALYLIADAAAAGGGLTASSWTVAFCGVALTLLPFAVESLVREEVKGALRVGLLGVALGLLLASSLGPAAVSMTRDLALAALFPFAAMLLLDLAFFAPDRAPESRLRTFFVLGAIVAGACGMADTLPAFELFGILLIAPPRFALAPPAFALGGLVLATLVRLRRRSWGSPESLASNAWALLGLVPAILVVAYFIYQGFSADLALRSDGARIGGAAAALLLAYGHAALVDPRRRLQAGATAREAIAFFLPATACVVLIVWLGPSIPRESAVVAAAGALILLAALWRGIRGPVMRVLSPYGGRLLQAIADGRANVGIATDLHDLGRAVLAPLRRAAGNETSPRLITLAPPREVLVDAAGMSQVRRAEIAEAIEVRLAEAPQDLMVTGQLRSRVVREAELRPVLHVLEAEESICAVPLGLGGEIEGVLFLPQGSRRVPLALEELDALHHLGREIGARLSLIGGRDRALARVGEVSAQAETTEEQVQSLSDEVEQLRADARVFRSGRARARQVASSVAYSESTRAFKAKLAEFAPVPGPITLIAEAGIPIDRIGQDLHEASGRAEGPYIVADASSVMGDEGAALLFGSDERAGWLNLARKGTLLLADLPALPLAVQHELAESLSVRQARPVGKGGYYPLDVRIIASSRLPLEPLVEVGAVDPELARWLGGMCVEVPSLRERQDDLPSLVLLALDRACRVLGNPPVGITQGALEVLTRYAWPGNLRELQHVIDQAVARSEGTQVRREDLPSLTGEQATSSDPLSGTYNEVEGRMLHHAMRLAGGNKSEAARMLGLKRTTFLDKLRRHEEATVEA